MTELAMRGFAAAHTLSRWVVIWALGNILLVGLLGIAAWVAVQFCDKALYMAGPSWAIDAVKFEPIEKPQSKVSKPISP